MFVYVCLGFRSFYFGQSSGDGGIVPTPIIFSFFFHLFVCRAVLSCLAAGNVCVFFFFGGDIFIPSFSKPAILVSKSVIQFIK